MNVHTTRILNVLIERFHYIIQDNKAMELHKGLLAGEDCYNDTHIC